VLHPFVHREPPVLDDKVIGLVSGAGGTHGVYSVINTMDFSRKGIGDEKQSAPVIVTGRRWDPTARIVIRGPTSRVVWRAACCSARKTSVSVYSLLRLRCGRPLPHLRRVLVCAFGVVCGGHLDTVSAVLFGGVEGAVCGPEQSG
jgi:hypothetical protein